MLRFKDWLIIAGIVIVCLGYECVPHGQSANAKHHLSAFAQSSDSGAFLSFGVLTIGFGLLLIVAACFVPRK